MKWALAHDCLAQRKILNTAQKHDHKWKGRQTKNLLNDQCNPNPSLHKLTEGSNRLTRTTAQCENVILSWSGHYDSFIESLDLPRELSVRNVLLFISHLSLAQYANRYIRNAIGVLTYHHSYSGMEAILDSDAIKKALVTAGTHETFEDKRVPVTLKMLQEFEQICDRDFPPYLAITTKCMVWFGTFCMLRTSELVGPNPHKDSAADHALLFENVCLFNNNGQEGVNVTLLSWKSSLSSTSLFFPFVAYFPHVAKWLNKYLKIRPPTSSSKHFFVTENGTAISNPFFTQVFNHLVDHSSWAGLHMSSHSMRAGGATICYHHSVQAFHICRLGHWHSNAFQRYIRDAYLEDPAALRASDQFNSNRSFCEHLSCQCTKVVDVNWATFLCQDNIRLMRTAANAKLGFVSPTLLFLQRLLITDHEPCLYSWASADWDASWLDSRCNGSLQTFKVALFLAFSHTKPNLRDAFFMEKPPGREVFPNTAIIKQCDTVHETSWLEEYNLLLDNAMLSIKMKLQSLKPLPNPEKLMPNFIGNISVSHNNI